VLRCDGFNGLELEHLCEVEHNKPPAFHHHRLKVNGTENIRMNMNNLVHIIFPWWYEGSLTLTNSIRVFLSFERQLTTYPTRRRSFCLHFLRLVFLSIWISRFVLEPVINKKLTGFAEFSSFLVPLIFKQRVRLTVVMRLTQGGDCHHFKFGKWKWIVADGERKFTMLWPHAFALDQKDRSLSCLPPCCALCVRRS